MVKQNKRLIPLREERLELARLLIELARGIHRQYMERMGKSFGAELELIFVAACVGIGDFEDRPMSGSDVAAYLDMPRATATRKLDELTKRHVVTREGNRYHLTQSTLDSVGYASKAIAKVKAIKLR